MKGKVLVKGLVLLVCLIMLPVPSVMAQEPCEADFNCDGNVDATDVDVFLEDFGRSPFFNPCPDCYDSPCPCTPAPVPKTGQTTCWDELGNPRDCAGTGEDGEHQKGVEWPVPRFTNNLDGTVTDNLTGLMWLKDANCIATYYPGFDNDGNAGDGAVTWQHALDFVSGINDGTYYNCQAGNTDWRLTNARELHSLIDYGGFPAIPEGHPFDNVQSNWDSQYYWSSTTAFSSLSEINDSAKVVHMHWAGVGNILKSDFNHVWPVRGGQ